MRFFYQVGLHFVVCLVLSLVRTRISSLVSSDDDDDDDDKNKNNNNNNDEVSTIFHAQFPLPNKSNPPCNIVEDCSYLTGDCLKCEFDYSCIYGSKVNTTCTASVDAKCKVRFDLIHFDHIGKLFIIISFSGQQNIYKRTFMLVLLSIAN